MAQPRGRPPPSPSSAINSTRQRHLPPLSPNRGSLVPSGGMARPVTSFDMDNSSSSSSRSPLARGVSDDSILKGAELIRRHIEGQNRGFSDPNGGKDHMALNIESETTDPEDLFRIIQQQKHKLENEDDRLSRSLIERMEDDEVDGLIRRVSSIQEDAKHRLGIDPIEVRPRSHSEDDWSDPFRSQSPLTAAEQTVGARSDFSGWSTDGDGLSQHGEHVSRGLGKARHRRFSDTEGLSLPRDDPSAWAAQQEVPPPADADAMPPPPSDDTPVTLMGRGKSLKLKIHTYHVQRTDEMGDSESYGDDTSLENKHESKCSLYSVLGAVHRVEEGPGASYIPKRWQVTTASSAPCLTTPTSPSSTDKRMMLKDPAYRHAQQAGHLWQTLVGRHVRFPAAWWNGARSPPMGILQDSVSDCRVQCQWRYVARHRLHSHPLLTKLVRNRSSAGRLLLHFVVRDLVTWMPVQDIALGVYHPNARGIRRTELAIMKEENCRIVWMAIRKRTDQDSVSVIDPLLTQDSHLKGNPSSSPLEGKQRVSNINMRAVYGDTPPLRTVFILESELYEQMTANTDDRPESPAALFLLKEFLSDI